MGAVIQSQPQCNDARQAHWDRLERADLFAQYRALRTQGLSERQAAKELKVPRTTLQAWRLWHDSLDICSHVAEFFQSGPGLAFLHRIVIAFHLVCVEVGACGIRLVCLFLHLTGLDRFVAASYGAQQQAEEVLAAASREHERLAQQRQQIKAHIRGIAHDYHFVDLERGVRRNGQLIASEIQGHIEHIRTIAQHEGLSQSCVERIEKAERVVPKMRATIEFVSGYVRHQVAQLDVTPPVSFAMHAKLIPSYYLDRIAQTRTVHDGEPLRALAERLRISLFEPGGV